MQFEQQKQNQNVGKKVWKKEIYKSIHSFLNYSLDLAGNLINVYSFIQH